MSFLRSLLTAVVDYDDRTKVLLDKISTCEKTLDSLSSQISSALNSNSMILKKIPQIKQSYNNLMSQLTSIAGTVSSLKNRFGVNVARVPASRNAMNNNVGQYINVKNGKYVVRVTPPINQMQSILVKLRKAHANVVKTNQEMRQVQNAERRSRNEAEAARIQRLRMQQANANRVKAVQNARDALTKMKGDVNSKRKTLGNLKRNVNKNSSNILPTNTELQEFV